MTKLSVGIVAAVLGARDCARRRTGGDSEEPATSASAERAPMSSTSKLKLSEEDGRIEVEFEVDQNRNGVRWNVVLFQNGKRIARMARVTQAPSGSFEARMLAADTSGKDTLHGPGDEPVATRSAPHGRRSRVDTHRCGGSLTRGSRRESASDRAADQRFPGCGLPAHGAILAGKPQLRLSA